jgi:hypothetical protein
VPAVFSLENRTGIPEVMLDDFFSSHARRMFQRSRIPLSVAKLSLSL